jgi:hypothetical protein
MKFFHHARLADTWLADDQHQLAIALSRSLPAPHQHGDFLVATDEWREMTLPCAASTAARPDQPK